MRVVMITTTHRPIWCRPGITSRGSWSTTVGSADRAQGVKATALGARIPGLTADFSESVGLDMGPTGNWRGARPPVEFPSGT